MKLLNLVNFGKAILFAHLFNKKTPINIMWRITNKCNSKCSYCVIWKKKQKELSTKQILSLIDQMAKCGTQRIGFVGGEAFLRKDFGQIVDYVKSKGIYVTLVSNGCLVPQNIDIVKKLDYLVLSFDGKKENHEKGRQKGLFDKLIKAFEVCKKNKIKFLTITVLNKYNIKDIDYILDTAKKYRFKCNFHVLQGISNYYPKNKEYKKAIDYLIKKKKQGAPIALSLKTLKFLKNWSDYKKFITKNKIKGFKCWAGKLLFNIDTNGRIAGCDIHSYIYKDNPNCIEIGFEKAYKAIKTHDCKACTCPPVIDYNYMFSLKPSVIFNWGKIIFRR
ncbi:MAG: radical SAM protein [Candidatus Thorarchaeota archaeon]